MLLELGGAAKDEAATLFRYLFVQLFTPGYSIAFLEFTYALELSNG